MRSQTHDGDSRMDEDRLDNRSITSDCETKGFDGRATLKSRRTPAQNIGRISFSDDETVVGSTTPSPIVQVGDIDRESTSDVRMVHIRGLKSELTRMRLLHS